MLQKPNLSDEQISACLRAAFDVQIARLEFLPLGADLDTAVYRAETADHSNFQPGGTLKLAYHTECCAVRAEH
jgi:spectinomycin phosphotransferase